MNLLVVALITVFCLSPSVARADEPLPSKKMAMDVIEWARHGSERFSVKYADQALFAKKKSFVLYGKIFEMMAKNGELPKGYSIVTNETLKDVDWSTTGMIAINKQFPEGGFGVNVSLGPLGMCGYRIIPKGDSYKVRDNGGS